MTNKEAIEHIKTIKIYSYQDGYTDEAREALDMAISALQAQDLQLTCNQLATDCVSRQAAIDAFNTNLNELVVGGEENAKTVENYLNRVLDKIKYLPSALSTNLAEVGTDCISRQAAIETIDSFNVFESRGDQIKLEQMIGELPPAQPERTCVNCGRTANNGGWYADGRTRCPIEEHYALPKDGYCHLWEKRSVTDDDYPERRTDGRD